MRITNEQWDIYLKKYDKLMWTIARKISGDDAIASIEDNYAGLCIAALDSMTSYARKENMKVDEILDTFGFDKYTKTVLWNYKAKKGTILTNKMNFRNKHVSIDSFWDDEDSSFEIEDKGIDCSSMVIEDLFKEVDSDVQKVINAILNDPDVLGINGNVKVFSLIKPTGLSIHAVNRAVDKIENILSKNYRSNNE